MTHHTAGLQLPARRSAVPSDSDRGDGTDRPEWYPDFEEVE